MDKVRLEELVQRRFSSHRIAKELGCSQTNVARWLRKYDLKTICKPGPKGDVKRGHCGHCGKQFNEVNLLYCNHKCRAARQYDDRIRSWKEGKTDGVSGWGTANFIRRYLTEKYGNKCSRCGWDEVNVYTKKVPLQIDHIDGDYSHNEEENLTLLCPNCHCLTPTWGGRNRGKGRPRYGIYAPVVKPAHHASLRKRKPVVEIHPGAPISLKSVVQVHPGRPCIL